MKLKKVALVAILGIGILPFQAAAPQPAPKAVTVGALWTTVPPGTSEAPAALVRGLRDLGYQEGQNLTIVFRHGDGTNESLAKLAEELVSLRPDVIIAAATPAALALKKATSTVPIVMISVGNPVEVGLVQSLANPGGNVTGRSNTAGAVDINLKRLQLISETIPGICCVTHLINPTNPANVAGTAPMIAEEKTLGIEPKWIEVSDLDRLNQFLATPLDSRFEKALMPTADALFWAHRVEIAEASLRRRIALFGPFREYAEAGALMSYGVDNDEEFRAVAVYVDKIVRGAKPGDLPIEQPTRFRLVVNLKTARAIGLTIPPAVLQRADEVIE